MTGSANRKSDVNWCVKFVLMKTITFFDKYTLLILNLFRTLIKSRFCTELSEILMRIFSEKSNYNYFMTEKKSVQNKIFSFYPFINPSGSDLSLHDDFSKIKNNWRKIWRNSFEFQIISVLKLQNL